MRQDRRGGGLRRGAAGVCLRRRRDAQRVRQRRRRPQQCRRDALPLRHGQRLHQDVRRGKDALFRPCRPRARRGAPLRHHRVLRALRAQHLLGRHRRAHRHGGAPVSRQLHFLRRSEPLQGHRPAADRARLRHGVFRRHVAHLRVQRPVLRRRLQPHPRLHARQRQAGVSRRARCLAPDVHPARRQIRQGALPRAGAGHHAP